MTKVLFVAAEAAPFAKTGGLGEVVGSLPKALRKQGIDARVIIPKYGTIPADYGETMTAKTAFTVSVGWREQYCGIEQLEYDTVPFYFVDNRYYFDRPGVYGFYDEAERYAFFCRSVLAALPYLDFVPHILHCHDWHTGMVSVFLAAYYRSRSPYHHIRTLFTVHNLKYQGVFPKEVLGDLLGLGWEYFTMHSLEFYDQVNFMKGGLVFSDMISTVSKTYAEEIQTPYFGEKLDGVIRERHEDLRAIINGIDYERYDPATDPHVFVRYDRESPERKGENKVQLQAMLGLPVNRDLPLIGIVSRLVPQKGLDLVIHVLEEILALNIQMVVLGTGDEKYQQAFWHAAQRHPDKLSVCFSFDDTLARRIYAGSDLFLMPSLYEPCGIAQLIAMRYGSLPVVRETGGLKDTVRPYNEYTGEGNGFSFTNINAHDMLYTIERAVGFYQNKPVWRRIVAEAMQADYSWDNSAQQYQALYETLLDREAAVCYQIPASLKKHSPTSCRKSTASPGKKHPTGKSMSL